MVFFSFLYYVVQREGDRAGVLSRGLANCVRSQSVEVSERFTWRLRKSKRIVRPAEDAHCALFVCLSVCCSSDVCVAYVMGYVGCLGHEWGGAVVECF
jgi:hypothetical protein